jgi:hypothetical protein
MNYVTQVRYRMSRYGPAPRQDRAHASDGRTLAAPRSPYSHRGTRGCADSFAIGALITKANETVIDT